MLAGRRKAHDGPIGRHVGRSRSDRAGTRCRDRVRRVERRGKTASPLAALARSVVRIGIHSEQDLTGWVGDPARKFAAHSRAESLHRTVVRDSICTATAFHRYKGLFLPGGISPCLLQFSKPLSLVCGISNHKKKRSRNISGRPMPCRERPTSSMSSPSAVRLGQPLWHPADRQDYDEATDPSAN